jgi:hypothetical protein
MDYSEQRKFLRSSRIWGAALVLVLFAAVGVCIKAGKVSDPKLSLFITRRTIYIYRSIP